jgi:hypothetical protein
MLDMVSFMARQPELPKQLIEQRLPSAGRPSSSGLRIDRERLLLLDCLNFHVSRRLFGRKFSPNPSNSSNPAAKTRAVDKRLHVQPAVEARLLVDCQNPHFSTADHLPQRLKRLDRLQVTALGGTRITSALV